jgi:hypothetical protein
MDVQQPILDSKCSVIATDNTKPAMKGMIYIFAEIFFSRSKAIDIIASNPKFKRLNYRFVVRIQYHFESVI